MPLATSGPGSAPEPFAGFPPEGTDFFLELQDRQSREWFKANQERYQRLWAQPMRALVEELVDQLAGAYPEITSVRPRVMRPQRDIRFSLDKSPYKTYIGASLDTRPRDDPTELVPGIYLHFGLSHEVVAMGCWHLEGDGLLVYREAVADDRRGPKLQVEVERLRGLGFEASSHNRLKRVPRPYPADHPRAELLTCKGVAVSMHEMPGDLFERRDFLFWVAERLAQAAPLARWLDETLKGIRSG